MHVPPLATGLALASALCAQSIPESPAPTEPRAQQTPHWIWADTSPTPDEALLVRTFELPAAATRIEVWATADNHLALDLDGRFLVGNDDWTRVGHRLLEGTVAAGIHTLRARLHNDGGPAGFALRLVAVAGDTTLTEVVSDSDWRAATGINVKSADQPVRDLGAVGSPAVVWSDTLVGTAFGLGPTPPTPQPIAPATGLDVHGPWAVDLVYDVRPDLGSWVALCADDRGRLYAAAEKGRGLYRIDPAPLDAQGDATTTVERVGADLGGVQGLCWLDDSLYVVVNDPDGSGLWRLRDEDGDDHLDRAELLQTLDGSGEHGPHAVVAAPDDHSLLVIAGNHTDHPPLSGSRIPTNWNEDLLLPRQWDPRGHARGRLAPGGWVAHVSLDGKSWEMWGVGFRNSYDVAVKPDGELFAFDADMEWDMGMPWYRPTRICHVTSGAEFGWRSGSGKWPEWYPDSLPPVLNFGPGSPTGLVFGTDTTFPQRYRRALFALDWTFGTLWAVHLHPEGATYTAEREPILTGAPLPLADVAVATDGALYFVTGGRGTSSAVYRLRWNGPSDAEPAIAEQPTEAAALRHRLESFHGHADPDALAAAWPHLGDDDRFVRYAARLAIEAQPVATWADRALAETGPRASTQALLALARQGDPRHLPDLLDALARFDPASTPPDLLRDVLRVYTVALSRLGPATTEQQEALTRRFTARYPTGDPDVDLLLVDLLVYLQSPDIVAAVVPRLRTDERAQPPHWAVSLLARNDEYGAPIRSMLADMPPTDQIALAFALRNATVGWTRDLRRDYVLFLQRAKRHPGGASYRGFLQNTLHDALASMRASAAMANDEAADDEVADDDEDAQPPPPLVPPKGPWRQWTLDDAIATVDGHLQGRSYERGRELFFAASCATCHRFSGEGGNLGPDLTTAGTRFGVRDLLTAILEPSRTISDQYGSSIVTLTDGRTLTGRVVEQDDDTVAIYPPDANTPPTVVPQASVKKTEPSPVSPMPPGLVNPLGPDELRDLIAFLSSLGDPSKPMFTQASGPGESR